MACSVACPVPRRCACNVQDTRSSCNTSRTRSPPCPYTTWTAAGSSERAVSMTCLRSARPASGCRTFGTADFIRLPSPAARITIDSGTARAASSGCVFGMAAIVTLWSRDSSPDGRGLVVATFAARLELGQLLPDQRSHVELRVRVSLVLRALAALDEPRCLLECLLQRVAARHGIAQEGFPEVREMAVGLTSEGGVRGIGGGDDQRGVGFQSIEEHPGVAGGHDDHAPLDAGLVQRLPQIGRSELQQRQGTVADLEPFLRAVRGQG